MKTNHKYSKRQKRESILALSFMMATGIIMTGAFVLTQLPPGTKTFAEPDESSQDVDGRFNELMTHVSRTNVCPGISPVLIYREVNGHKYVHCTGGILAGDNNIITCGHAFWNIPEDPKKPWKYFYQVLQPFSKALFPINRAQVIDKIDANGVRGSKDIIACIPGASRIIDPLQCPTEAMVEGDLKYSYTPLKEEIDVRSTVTGDHFRIIGSSRMENGPDFFVIDYNTFKSQSGTVFVAPDNRTVYLLSRWVKLNDKRSKIFNLPINHRGVGFCSSAVIN